MDTETDNLEPSSIGLSWEVQAAKDSILAANKRQALWKLKHTFQESDLYTKPLYIPTNITAYTDVEGYEHSGGERLFLLFDYNFVLSVSEVLKKTAFKYMRVIAGWCKTVDHDAEGRPILVGHVHPCMIKRNSIKDIFSNAPVPEDQYHRSRYFAKDIPGIELLETTVNSRDAFKKHFPDDWMHAPLYELRGEVRGPIGNNMFRTDDVYIRVGQCKKPKEVTFYAFPGSRSAPEPYISKSAFEYLCFNDTPRYFQIAVRNFKGQPTYIFPESERSAALWRQDYSRWSGVPSGRPPRFISQPDLELIMVPLTNDPWIVQVLENLCQHISKNNLESTGQERPCKQTAVLKANVKRDDFFLVSKPN